MSAKKEIQLLQAELAEMRKDKMQVEEQLKEALEEPIATPTITESNEGKIQSNVKIAVAFYTYFDQRGRPKIFFDDLRDPRLMH